MAGDELMGDAARRFRECAEVLLRELPAESLRESSSYLAQSLFDSDWSPSPHAAEVDRLLRRCLQAGVLRPEQRLPDGQPAAVTLPLASAILNGNANACAALLEAGADVAAAAKDLKTDDLVHGPNTERVAAMLAEHAMTLVAARAEAPATSNPLDRRRARHL